VSYRHADPDCARELELEQRHLLEEEEHRRAEDRAIVRAMTSPLVALGSQIPRGATRTAAVVALVAIMTPALCAASALVFEDRRVTGALSLVAFGSGSVLGLACSVLSVRALLTETSARFAGMVALFVGLVAPIWAISARCTPRSPCSSSRSVLDRESDLLALRERHREHAACDWQRPRAGDVEHGP